MKLQSRQEFKLNESTDSNDIDTMIVDDYKQIQELPEYQQMIDLGYVDNTTALRKSRLVVSFNNIEKCLNYSIYPPSSKIRRTRINSNGQSASKPYDLKGVGNIKSIRDFKNCFEIIFKDTEKVEEAKKKAALDNSIQHVFNVNYARK